MNDGVVKQLDQIGGIVVECSLSNQCMDCNPDYASAANIGNGCRRKNCLLSVQNHGERCLAYPQDSSLFLIDADMAKIKRLPT